MDTGPQEKIQKLDSDNVAEVAEPNNPEPGVNSSKQGQSGSDSRNCQDENRTPNPLFFDMILSNIGTYLGHNSLKAARSVCRAWDNILFPVLEKRTTIYVNCSPGPEHSIQRFITTFNTARTHGRVYTSFQFPLPCKLELPEISTNWIPKHGGFVKHLIITYDPNTENRNDPFMTYDGDEEEVEISTLESILFDWFPNLEHLEIPCPQITTRKFSSNNQQKMERRRRRRKRQTKVPKVTLKSLSLGNGKEVHTVSSTLRPMQTLGDLEIIADLIFKSTKEIHSLTLSTVYYCERSLGNRFANQETSLSFLRKLDIGYYPVDQESFQSLIHLNLQNLKEIRIGAITTMNETVKKNINSFFTFYGSRLEKISLVSWEIRPGGMVNHHDRHDDAFQTQNSILLASFGLFQTQSTIKSLNVALPRWNIGALDILLNLPELTDFSLSLCDEQQSYYDDAEEAAVKLKMVKDIFHCEDSLRLSERKHIRLTKLQLNCPVNPQIMGLVAECFPSLRSLSVRLPEENLTQSGCLREMTFIPKLESLELLLMRTAGECWGGEDRTLEMDEGLVQFTEFKALRRLEITVEEPEEPLTLEEMTELSPETIVNGILKIPHLTSLSLTRLKISTKAFLILLKAEKDGIHLQLPKYIGF